MSVAFGIFDWLDDAGVEAAELYEHRLRLVELADRLPFRAYHVAEHHGFPIGLAPSPNVFLAAAAARTTRIRLGALVNVLPLYDPLRLIEEVCMLDHLSRGRLDLGVGRGASPYELAAFGVGMEEARERFRETLGVLLEGLRTGRVERDGSAPASTLLRPVQEPYPPLWYPTTSPDSVLWAAREGLQLMMAFVAESHGVSAREQIEHYERELRAHEGEPGRLNGHVTEPVYGNMRHVVVAETDAEAERLARPALRRWFENFNAQWVANQGTEHYPSDVDTFIGKGFLLVGSPETVREQVARTLAEEGGNYFVGAFAFGDLPPEAAQSSLDLFGRHVAPTFG